jgi:glycosyltransferase involved in cell wall biosynthesis
MKSKVKVSVVVASYNHGEYIAKALDSILAQKVNFAIEIIVVDDGSTDSSLAIIDAFAQQYPEKIIVLKSTENQGVRKNIFRSKAAINSDYVAILDGDDYWSYDLKLQTQIDFLDEHKEYNGAFHDTKIIHDDTAGQILFPQKKYYSQNYKFNEDLYPSDIISRQVILPSSSAVLRIDVLKDEEWALISDNYSFLWKLSCLLIRASKFRFFNEVWSVYRNHANGISKANNSKFHLSHTYFLKNLLQDPFYLNHQYDVYRSIVNEYEFLLNLKNDLQRSDKRKLFREYLWYELLKIWHYRKRLIKNHSI